MPGVIVPHLVVRDAAEAVDFYVRAFRASVLFRSPSPSRVGEHVHLRIWASLVQVSTVEPAQRGQRAEGASPALPPTDMFWGDRYGWVCDPFGHVWALTTVKEVLTRRKVEQRMAGFSAQVKGQD
jgi:uncharacterized glyoxalase superfamily protein PhnB